MVSESPRILVIGYNAFDVTVPITGFPEPDTKNQVPFIGLGGGGPGATAAVALSRLGASVKLLTPLTGDLGGQTQKNELEKAGVDFSLSPILKEYDCAKAVILVQPDTGHRTIFWSRGGLPRLEADLWQDFWLDGIDLLYLDGHEPGISLVAARKARDLGIPVVLDAGTVRDGSEELVPLCTDVISSSVFATSLAGLEDPLEALRDLQSRGPSRVAMTFGVDGVLALHDHPFRVPSFQVATVDTTGAGDVFHAGYAYALSRGDDFRSSLVFGSATAALKCAHWGGRGGLPLVKEVWELINNGGTNALAPGCFPE
jgi:sulfofructose kinase